MGKEKSEKVEEEDLIEPSERELALHGSLAALTKLRAAIENVPDDEAAVVHELEHLRQSARRLQVPSVAVTRPLLSRLTLLSDTLEEAVPQCLSSSLRLKKLAPTAFKPLNTKAHKACREVVEQSQRLDHAGRLQAELADLARWVKEVEGINSRGGSLVQPRDVEKFLMKRLRRFQLPPRFITQLDEAEALVSDNQMRLLQAGRVENPDYGFALLNHEVEILDGIITGIAAATSALKLSEVEVKYCVEQLEIIQATMTVLQGIPVAVEPVMDKLKVVGESRGELSSSALALHYALKPLIRSEDQTLDKKLRRFGKDAKQAKKDTGEKISLFFGGLRHETVLLVGMLLTAVGSCFTGVALIGYSLLTGQSMSDSGTLVIGVGMISGGAMLGLIAIISVLTARLHRKVLAMEGEEEDMDMKTADTPKKDKDKETWSAAEEATAKQEREKQDEIGKSSEDERKAVQDSAREKETAVKKEPDKFEVTQEGAEVLTLGTQGEENEVPEEEEQQNTTGPPMPGVPEPPHLEGSNAEAEETTARSSSHQVVTTDATAEEMVAYARHLGIDPTMDADLLWIAEQAFTAPVPENWVEHLDDDENVYYFNNLTGISSWTHPLEDHFRSLFIRCKVEKEKTRMAEEKAEERRKKKALGLDDDSVSSRDPDDDDDEEADVNTPKHHEDSNGLSHRARHMQFVVNQKSSSSASLEMSTGPGTEDGGSGGGGGGGEWAPAGPGVMRPAPPKGPPPPPPRVTTSVDPLEASFRDVEEMQLGQSFRIARRPTQGVGGGKGGGVVGIGGGITGGLVGKSGSTDLNSSMRKPSSSRGKGITSPPPGQGANNWMPSIEERQQSPVSTLTDMGNTATGKTINTRSMLENSTPSVRSKRASSKSSGSSSATRGTTTADTKDQSRPSIRSSSDAPLPPGPPPRPPSGKPKTPGIGAGRSGGVTPSANSFTGNAGESPLVKPPSVGIGAGARPPSSGGIGGGVRRPSGIGAGSRSASTSAHNSTSAPRPSSGSVGGGSRTSGGIGGGSKTRESSGRDSEGRSKRSSRGGEDSHRSSRHEGASSSGKSRPSKSSAPSAPSAPVGNALAKALAGAV